MLFSAILAWALLVSPVTVGEYLAGDAEHLASFEKENNVLHGPFFLVLDHWAMIRRYFELVAEPVLRLRLHRR